ncbi:MAG: hypothetical protein WDN24_02505 [Sphingomonas sp.]
MHQIRVRSNVRISGRPWVVLLLFCLPPAWGAPVTQDAAQDAVQDRTSLASSAKNNQTIRFESSQLTSGVGQTYKDDLNRAQQFREVYPLILRRDEVVVLELSSKVFDPMLQIMSADGKELASDDDSGDDGRSSKLAFAAPQAGTFYLVVTSVDKRGGDFALTATARRAPPPAPAAPISVGNLVPGRFDKRSSLRVEDQQIYASYYFEATAEERVQIDARSKFSIDLELLRDGKTVKTGFSGSAGAYLYHPIAATGRYQINVLAKPETVGSYELLLRKLPKPKTAATPQSLPIGKSEPGEFFDDSPIVSNAGNRPYSLFEINGAAGDKIALSVKWDGGSDFSGDDASPISLEVGADTPAGFAELRRAPSIFGRPARLVTVTFERAGPLLVRVTGRGSIVGKFTVKSERVVPAAAPEPAAASPATSAD